MAIHTLIEEAARVFIENEDAILRGEFSVSLLDRSIYKAQVNDIIKLSVEKIYKSEEVTEKEIAGYAIVEKLLDVFCKAALRKLQGEETHYDKLVLQLIPEKYRHGFTSEYCCLLGVSCFVASLTDGRVVGIYNKIGGGQIN